jgi:hypothetical protein
MPRQPSMYTISVSVSQIVPTPALHTLWQHNLQGASNSWIYKLQRM